MHRNQYTKSGGLYLGGMFDQGWPLDKRYETWKQTTPAQHTVKTISSCRKLMGHQHLGGGGQAFRRGLYQIFTPHFFHVYLPLDP